MLLLLSHFSRVWLLVTPWTEAYQGPPSMGFSRQEYWSGVPSPSPISYTAAAAKSLQSCPTLCNPIDGSPAGSPVPGILQARTLEWVAISFSNAWKGKVKVKLLSRVRLLATPWTAAHQAPPSVGFSRQEYWNGVPFLTLGRLKMQIPRPHLRHSDLAIWWVLGEVRAVAVCLKLVPETDVSCFEKHWWWSEPVIWGQ